MSVEQTGNIIGAMIEAGLLTDIDAVASAIVTIKSAFEGNVGAPRGEPAVPIDKSITPSHVICLEDGKKLKMLKRYLRTHYNLTPEEYRARWGLPPDYPMTAPNYSKRRSKVAKETGLGKAPIKRAKKKRS